jgi:hypothetical protein
MVCVCVLLFSFSLLSFRQEDSLRDVRWWRAVLVHVVNGCMTELSSTFYFLKPNLHISVDF